MRLPTAEPGRGVARSAAPRAAGLPRARISLREGARTHVHERVRVLFVLVKLEKNGAVLNTLSIMRQLDPVRFEPVLFLVQHTNTDPYWEPLLAGLQVVYGTSQRAWKRRLHRILPELYVAARDADVIVGALEASSTYLAILAARLTYRPSLGLVQNSLLCHLKYVSGTHRQLMRQLYPRLTLAVGVSVGVQEELERFIPKLSGRVRTSYNLVDVTEIRSASRGPLLERYPPRPFILAAGRLNHQKGFDLLVRAYAALGSSVAHDLVILGDGPQRTHLERLAYDLGVAERVRFVHFQTNPYTWMRRSTIFVTSSRYEGFCRVIVEALVVGVPVIATDCPSGPAEILQGGLYGTLVPPNDVASLSSAIGTLLGDAERRRELRTLSLERASAFDVKLAKRSFESVVLEAVETYKGRPHLGP